jgi:hypothetical protein
MFDNRLFETTKCKEYNRLKKMKSLLSSLILVIYVSNGRQKPLRHANELTFLFFFIIISKKIERTAVRKA